MPRAKARTARRANPAATLTEPPGATRIGKVPAAAGALRGLARLGEALGVSPKLVAACDAGASGLDQLTDKAHALKAHVDAAADIATPIVADAISAVRSAPPRARKDTP